MARTAARQAWVSLVLSLQLAGCRIQDDFVAAAIRSSNGSGGGPTGGTADGGAPTGGAADGGAADGGAADGGAADGGRNTGTGGLDSSGGASAQGGSPDTCPSDRPAISVPLGDGTRQRRCSSWAARRSFAQALCSCSDLSVKGALTTSSVDSSRGDTNASRSAAAVSVNRTYHGSDYVRVGGSFTVAGTATIDVPGGIDVSGDLRLAGNTSTAGPILIGRDAWLLEDASSLSIANVGRDLHLAPGAQIHSLGPVVVAGTTSKGSFTLAPPCACAAGETLDVANVVTDALTDNDDAVLGLNLDSLADVATPTDLTLRCGRFALRGIAGSAPLTLRVSGRVALMVEGDVQIPSDFVLTLEPQAELDWFISGNLALSRDTRIGDSARPAAVRVYVLGDGDIDLPASKLIAMNLYAPRANLNVGALGDVYGALFANSISSPIPLVEHYDRAVLHADDACSLPLPTSCSACEQCGSTSTCSGGTCTACQSDSDCCFPLACEQGECRGLPAD